MHIVISVGHKTALAIIPVSALQIDESVRASINGVSMRLEAMLKGRVEEFDYSFYGHKMEVQPVDLPYAQAVNTIIDVVQYARYIQHDHVRFELTENLEAYLKGAHQRVLNLSTDVMSIGIHREVQREWQRLESLLVTYKTSGINKPEIEW